MDDAESARNSKCKKVENGMAFLNAACAHFDASVNERQGTLTCAIKTTDRLAMR